MIQKAIKLYLTNHSKPVISCTLCALECVCLFLSFSRTHVFMWSNRCANIVVKNVLLHEYSWPWERKSIAFIHKKINVCFQKRIYIKRKRKRCYQEMKHEAHKWWRRKEVAHFDAQLQRSLACVWTPLINYHMHNFQLHQQQQPLNDHQNHKNGKQKISKHSIWLKIFRLKRLLKIFPNWHCRSWKSEIKYQREARNHRSSCLFAPCRRFCFENFSSFHIWINYGICFYCLRRSSNVMKTFKSQSK